MLVIICQTELWRYRACLGVNFAESSMFIAIATALATCTFSNASDNGGAPIPKDVQLKTGTIR